ncbi:MAG: hypothetical protein V2I33_01395 [Kangiellaceae bacterium]|jgi:hypothetical protein|nr:hypothetical protein [Kangiellaceae bacterium]
MKKLLLISFISLLTFTLSSHASVPKSLSGNDLVSVDSLVEINGTELALLDDKKSSKKKKKKKKKSKKSKKDSSHLALLGNKKSSKKKKKKKKSKKSKKDSSYLASA